MPELPEVETVARALRAEVLGRSISEVCVLDPKLAHLAGSALPGKRLLRVERRGKYINCHLSDRRVLQLHLMMSGRLLLRRTSDPADRFARVLIGLDDDRQLRFCDARRFGRAAVLSPARYREFDAGLGPEPLGRSFSSRLLGERLMGRRVALKSALLDQRILAGVGNIYADEALFRARISPLRPAGSLDSPALRRLHRALRHVLRASLALGGTTFGIYANAHGDEGAFQAMLRVFRRTGEPCPRCRTAIKRLLVGGRATHYCPRCQGG
ncbi:MAG: bifunctional DNA-formamidopyrimidine glycosylase/DNA-(apurinic or apyrimidinic site) lyase [Chloroflexi bacterium]|nr:bifunctional DNA-formamidopyrimidine glycosylase/DNA-(apurinic or apyrimidinic site) lyase [Chloroflexota bacterium]MXX99207.1 bifunctional DNA-formamidopyrimidine glycosylase/DNA-(apurinic or apyrimidinic site) lyase [Chloroflexota bacterium]MYC46998.1 bifunctional DNA-formamidopyrimidine glycosylase/DNA-(apurinic or apyrimidinic site) lyase [Chloroflexota bacterium]